MQLRTQLRISRWLLVAGVGFTAAAMMTYPGGVWQDPTVPSYSFFRNSLSDLGARTALNGQSNVLTAAFFAGGLFLVAVAGALSVWALSRLYAALGAARWLQPLTAASAAVACVAFASVAFVAEDVHPE